MFLDLVEVSVEGLRVCGDTAPTMVALETLNTIRVLSANGSVRLFNQPRRRRGTRPLTAKVRAEHVIVRGTKTAPVFSGRVVAKPVRLNEFLYGSNEAVDIKLDLNLNVARFVAAQIFNGAGLFDPVAAQQPLKMAGPREAIQTDDETMFGGDGNVLMGDERVYAYASFGGPITHLNRLMNEIVGLVLTFLSDSPHIENDRIEFVPRFALNKAEWYVEFLTLDPRRQVKHLMPSLSRQGRSGNIYKRKLTGQVRTFGPHSLAMQIDLAEGIKQTTYAKTNRRIRFEVKYSRKCLGRLVGRRTQLSSSQFSDALDRLREYATRQLQQTFAELNKTVEPLGEQNTRDDLCIAIAFLSEDSHVAEEIIRSLRDIGRVTVRNGSELRPTITRLCNACVLRFVRHSVYSVTASYEFALRELMTQPGAAMAREVHALQASAASRSAAT
ncbi:hypothetical protein [Mameliella sp.]|uniref:hypothetical protein n=1 Tax=Mameliella sp. TaxID=1924940 RepID=UPI003B50A7C9